MKATGIVRRIDDLGRVVIPKEIRRTMRIREGDPLEIFVDNNGEVIFKKYSLIGELTPFAGQYAEVLYKVGEVAVIITDRDRVVASGGLPKKDVMDHRVTAKLENIMEQRKIYIKDKNTETAEIVVCEGFAKSAGIIVPVISQGDVIGSVCTILSDENGFPIATDVKLASVAAEFLAKQMES